MHQLFAAHVDADDYDCEQKGGTTDGKSHDQHGAALFCAAKGRVFGIGWHWDASVYQVLLEGHVGAVRHTCVVGGHVWIEVIVLLVVDNVSEVCGLADWADADLEVVAEAPLPRLEREGNVVLMEERTAKVVDVLFVRFLLELVDADEASVFEAGDAAVEQEVFSRDSDISLCVFVLNCHVEWDVIEWDLVAGGLEDTWSLGQVTVYGGTEDVFDVILKVGIII